MGSKLYYCCNDVLEDTPGGKVIVSICWLEQRVSCRVEVGIVHTPGGLKNE